ncbi:hypothetical protein PJF56_18430 [Roseofilum sp. BLCC_M91]|uniref:Uncharacterized protein n=1 Tax=Roseofilum halophilum BLCC-M91 TaxID=3022259 RepID=A0ABT7BNS5_9CYAN|nr:hypothetical protein [Roseofilum halophilum]MDJ1180841.1 hypothetical protein [Roseofilum halophilum BLCC-M91]
MSAYIPVELRQQIRDRFGNCCAYCHTAEFLTEMIGLTEVGRAAIATLQMNRPALVRAREMWVELGEHPPVTDDY